MNSEVRDKIRESIKSWGCLGYYGYGHGRAAAEVDENLLGDTMVCSDVCPKAMKCRMRHSVTMDGRYPQVADIIKHTLNEAQNVGIGPVQAVVTAMTVAVNRDVAEARRIQAGLRRFRVETMTDHYMYGQLENLDNGLNKRDPKTAPILPLLGATFEQRR